MTEAFTIFRVERVVEFQDTHGDTWSEVNYEMLENLEPVVNIRWTVFGVMEDGRTKIIHENMSRTGAAEMAMRLSRSAGAEIEICPGNTFD